MFWIKTYTGRRFHLDKPCANDVYIGDIAHSLGNLCRFVGHCNQFYSVAQHSVLVAELCPPELKLWGLLHDAAEAYVGDLSRPLRSLLGVIGGEAFDFIEGNILRVIAERFGLMLPIPDRVIEVDNHVLITEAKLLHPGGVSDWACNSKPFPDLIVEPLGPYEASCGFIDRFRELYSRK